MAAGEDTAAATGTSSSRRLRVFYALLLLGRFLCILLPGYIHPDEFYQGGQELFFGVPPSPDFAALYPDGFGGTWTWTSEDGLVTNSVVPTWEFEPRNAIRSIVPPLFMTVLPLKVYVVVRRLLGPLLVSAQTSSSLSLSVDGLSGFEIWAIPRLFLALLSILMIDLPCYILIKRFDIMDRQDDDDNKAMMGLVALASSWPALTFLCRPFTNTLEAMVLSVLLAVISGGWCVGGRSEETHRGMAVSILVGILSSAGIFVRFTFAFFALPPVMMHLVKKGKIGRILGHGTLAACGFLVTTIAFVAADTKFYSQLSSSTGQDGGSIDDRAEIGGHYITPLNALLYNSNVENLEDHGIHPRITHLLVNLPMLFGPLAFFFYADIVVMFGGLLRKKKSRGKQQRRGPLSPNSGPMMCQLAIGSGLFLLSCAPHQEPRFLLPAIVPLVVLYGTNLTKGRRWLQYFWLLFNSLLLIFFGLLHQSGVVPSLLASNQIASSSGMEGPAMFLYHHTYMPPSFLTRRLAHDSTAQCSEGGDACSANRSAKIAGHHIIDLKDVRVTALRYSFNVALECRVEDVGQEKVFVVAPASVEILPQVLSLVDFYNYSVEGVYKYWPHITTEDMPRWQGSLGSLGNFGRQFRMTTHEITCA